MSDQIRMVVPRSMVVDALKRALHGLPREAVLLLWADELGIPDDAFPGDTDDAMLVEQLAETAADMTEGEAFVAWAVLDHAAMLRLALGSR